MGEKRKVITIRYEDNFEKWSVTSEVYDLLQDVYKNENLASEYLDEGMFYTFIAILEHFQKKFRAEKLERKEDKADFEFTDC